MPKILISDMSLFVLENIRITYSPSRLNEVILDGN